MALVIFSQIERNARAHVQSMVYLEVSPSKERCAMCEFLGQLSSSHDFLAIFALAHSKINQITKFLDEIIQEDSD